MREGSLSSTIFDDHSWLLRTFDTTPIERIRDDGILEVAQKLLE